MACRHSKAMDSPYCYIKGVHLICFFIHDWENTVMFASVGKSVVVVGEGRHPLLKSYPKVALSKWLQPLPPQPKLKSWIENSDWVNFPPFIWNTISIQYTAFTVVLYSKKIASSGHKFGTLNPNTHYTYTPY